MMIRQNKDSKMQAKVISLFGNSDYEGALFDSKRKYLVPQYQRPYTWGEKQIDEFKESLERCLTDKVFFGTVQFSKENNKFHIIDGQQRMTTFLLLLKFIELSVNNFKLSVLVDVEFKNLANADKEFKFFLTEFSDENEGSEESLKKMDDFKKSSYFKNYEMLKEKFGQVDLKVLFEKIKQNVYFVELLTENISLPDIVSIFNTINTTGLELNATDLFKLHYYEYLKSRYSQNEEDWMQMITECYDFADKNNSLNMKDFLSVLKHCVVAENKLKWEYVRKSDAQFWQDALKDDRVKNSAILSKNNFKRILELVSDFCVQLDTGDSKLRREIDNDDRMLAFVEKLIKKSRYSQYWTLPSMYVVFNCKESYDDDFKQNEFMEALRFGLRMAKFLFVYSIGYDKVINATHTKVCNDVFAYVVGEKTKNNKLDLKLTEIDKARFDERLKGNIFEKRTRADILCLLIEILDSVNNRYDNGKMKETDDIIKSVFAFEKNDGYDIDHICPQDVFGEKNKEHVEIFNSLGNLVVLESSVNRSVKEALFFVDRKSSKGYKNKLEAYNGSRFFSANVLGEYVGKQNREWDLENVEDRLIYQSVRLYEFLMS